MKIIALLFVCLAIACAQETAAPGTAAPETQAPETAAPETAAPETQAPATQAPETQAPETQAPETQAPVATTATPGTKKPHTKRPHSKRPHTQGPHKTTKGPQKCGCLCRYGGCMAIATMPKSKEVCFRFLRSCATKRKCTLKKCNGPLAACMKKADGNFGKRAGCIKQWVSCFRKNQKQLCKKKKGGKGKGKKPE